MSDRHCAQFALRRRAKWVIGGLLTAVSLLVSPGAASPPIICVQEDWELVIREPDQQCESPQITCVMSPVDDTDRVHAVFEINHSTVPQYVAGGMQVQLWDNEV